MPDWLFGYGGDRIDSPKAFVYVPVGMTTEQFLDKVGSFSFNYFGDMVQKGEEVALKGDLKQVDMHIGTIVRLNEKFAKEVGELIGIKEYVKFLMNFTILNHIQQGKPITNELSKYAAKYDISLK